MLTVPEIENVIKDMIKASNIDDPYTVGLRNGMRFCLYLIDGNEPEYETAKRAEGAEE